MSQALIYWRALAKDTSHPEVTEERASLLDKARQRAFVNRATGYIVLDKEIAPADGHLVAQSLELQAEFSNLNHVGMPVYKWTV